MVLILPLIILYIFSPGIERQFYVNEIFSLFGFLIFISRFRRGSFPMYSIIEKLMFILISYSIFHLLISYFIKDSLYIYLRHSVIVYSMFSFYLGDYLYRKKSLIIKYFKLFAFFTFITNSFAIIYSGMRTTIGLFFNAIITTNKSYNIILYILLTIWAIIIFHFSSTITFCFIIITILIIFKSYKFFKISISLIFTGIIVSLILLDPIIQDIYKSDTYFGGGKSSLLGTNIYLSTITGNLSLDNIIPRIILWHQVLIESFPKYLIGSGFGTIMWPYPNSIPFDPARGLDIWQNHIYLIGPHNSFITLLGRLGIISIIIIINIYRHLLKYFIHHFNLLIRNKDLIFFLTFFMMSAITFFNAVLESPLHASLFWITLGLTNHAYKVNKIINYYLEN